MNEKNQFQAPGVFIIDNPSVTLHVSNSIHKEKKLFNYENDFNEPLTANVIHISFGEIADIHPSL